MLTKQHLPIIKAARDLIDSGDESFICYALGAAGDALDESGELADEVSSYIQREIGRCNAYLTEWARFQDLYHSDKPSVWWLAQVPYDHPRHAEAAVQRRMMRLAWLDKLIKDLE